MKGNAKKNVWIIIRSSEGRRTRRRRRLRVHNTQTSSFCFYSIILILDFLMSEVLHFKRFTSYSNFEEEQRFAKSSSGSSVEELICIKTILKTEVSTTQNLLEFEDFEQLLHLHQNTWMTNNKMDHFVFSVVIRLLNKAKRNTDRLRHNIRQNRNNELRHDELRNQKNFYYCFLKACVMLRRMTHTSNENTEDFDMTYFPSSSSATTLFFWYKDEFKASRQT